MRIEGDYSEKMLSSGHRLSVKSALNPILWLCLVASPTSFAAAYWLSHFPVALTTFVILGSLPILVATVSFVYLLLKDPNRLQSEEHQQRHHLSQIVQSKSAELGEAATTALLHEIIRSTNRLESGEEK